MVTSASNAVGGQRSVEEQGLLLLRSLEVDPIISEYRIPRNEVDNGIETAPAESVDADGAWYTEWRRAELGAQSGGSV